MCITASYTIKFVTDWGGLRRAGRPSGVLPHLLVYMVDVQHPSLAIVSSPTSTVRTVRIDTYLAKVEAGPISASPDSGKAVPVPLRRRQFDIRPHMLHHM